MSSASSKASSARDAVGAFQTYHSAKTYNPGTPGIEPWMRETLLALQRALNQIADAQVAAAQELEQQGTRLARIERHLNSQR